MKTKMLMLACAMSGFAVMAGCSSPSVIETRDGNQIMTADEPETDNDTGFVEAEKDGKKVQVNKSDVKSIEEVK
ncbi:YgdI/YgdR family lipoprotein [Bordetella sp. 02P26C-1]|uniref:YgdI/YgdR family lipoprotein n=1 Tax=Bordetella sp. 02P26C-1 TaxID=2683195 RepID=UPI0013521DE2|nr:YgdI/YgdR family lipoprotein [Bordetella sp. 02P26C-1]MVW80652.1 YgdI/YgdR family lipoprotein [Bordetella sp. 02P26C-1]